jgi:uncharacterized protein (TIGR00251 family)
VTHLPWLERRGEELRLRLHVQPRSSRTEVVGQHGDRLKLRLKAAPEGGAANTELCAFLAKAFGVPRARVTLLAGPGNRDKTVSIVRPARTPEWLAAGGG